MKVNPNIERIPRRTPQEPDPDASRAEVDEWIEKSRHIRDPRLALGYAELAVRARPDDPETKEALQLCIFDLLSRDAFLGFVAEDDKRYVIAFRNAPPMVIPKSRSTPEMFPPQSVSDGERALSGIWWMLLGIIPAGIGALILGPVVIWRSLNVLDAGATDERDRRMAWLALLLAAGLCLLGLIFGLLLALHFN